MPAIESPMDGHDPSDLSSFQRHVSDLFSDLSSSSDQLLSLSWIRRLLDTFLICLEEFRFILQTAAPALSRSPNDRLAADFFDRAVKSLDLCTAVRDGIDRLRTWQKHVQIVVGSLGPGSTELIGLGSVRRARKSIGDLAIMMLDERDLPGSGSGSGFRNRSFGRSGIGGAKAHHHRRSSSGGGGGGSSSSGSSGNGHFRSMTWSVSRNWSATKQLQAIGSGLTAPRGSTSLDLSSVIYTMGSVLFVSMYALAASIPCQLDRSAGLSGTHFSPPPRGTPWGPHIHSIYEKVLEEWRRKEKERKSGFGLLREIGEMERLSRQIGEVIDEAELPVEGEKEMELREMGKELERVCDVLKEGLDPLERQVREVFNRIVRSRTEGLDRLSKGQGLD